MTKLDQLYDRLLDEVPQLKVYLHRDAKGRIIAGPRGRYFEAPILFISERSGLDLSLWYAETADGRPTGRHPNATYDASATQRKGLHTQDQDRIVNLIEAYVVRVIKLIDGMEQNIQPQRDTDTLTELGFNVCKDQDPVIAVLTGDDVSVKLDAPYCYRSTTSGFHSSFHGDVLVLGTGMDRPIMEIFATLEEALEGLQEGYN